MVHGLWSSPLTWMPMFNDLRSFQELRQNYQFGFISTPQATLLGQRYANA